MPMIASANDFSTPAAHTPAGLPGYGLHPSPADLEPALKQIRQMPEFQPPGEGPLDALLKHPWVRELAEKVGQTLDQALASLRHLLGQVRPPGIAGLPENIRDLFSGFIGFLLVLMLLYAFYLMLGWLLQARERQVPQAPAEIRVADQSLLISSGYHAHQAQALTQAGRHGEALRQLYLALLCLLDERAVLPFEPTRSNREYTQQLSGQPHWQQTFQQIARRFEAMRYGRQAVNAEQFARCQSLYRELSQQESAHG